MSPRTLKTSCRLSPMITHLSIRGLAIIEELNIEFSPQLNVITGETGAGKSILIKALHLLLGVKADPDVIRRGFERAHVAASFQLPWEHASVHLLEQHGLVSKESQTLDIILRREIQQKGRSQAWVNDQPITQALLKELGQTLIDIYGQHENHRMLDPSTHVEYIDQFLKDQKLKDQLTEAMLQLQSQLSGLRKRLDQYHAKKKEQDFLQFRYDAIAIFDPSLEDYAKTIQVCQEASRFASEQKIMEQAQYICDEGYQGRGLSSAINELIKLCEQSKILYEDTDVQGSLQPLKELAPILDELSYHLGRAGTARDLDEEEVEAYQNRLAGYQSLFRKAGVRSIEELMAEYDRIGRELSFAHLDPEELAEELRGLHTRAKAVDKLARRLSQERRKAAQKAVGDVEKELHDLNMKGARIDFEFQDVRNSIPDLDLRDFDVSIVSLWQASADILSETSRYGREKGQFLLAANPGEGFKALAKVASGGEISRIMLGFKKALAVGATTSVMVFDEIDTGISGHTAHIVGKKLKDLARRFQVVCISHLPQVAVYNDAHFRVEKAQKGKSTESRIFRLSPSQSEEEIARLLSGDQVTHSSLAHAKQLISAAKATTV